MKGDVDKTRRLNISKHYSTSERERKRVYVNVSLLVLSCVDDIECQEPDEEETLLLGSHQIFLYRSELVEGFLLFLAKL